jgi:hypothetical protein
MISMRSRKTVVIGVTVNLEHYENLRLEVSGEVESTDDTDDLIGYLDEVLGRLGREDQTTADRIDSYRRRVLARASTGLPPSAPSVCHDGVCPLPADLLSNVTRPEGASPAALRATRPPRAPAPVPRSPAREDAPVTPPQEYPGSPGKTSGRPPDSPGDTPGIRDQPGTKPSPGNIQNTSGKGVEPGPGKASGMPGITPSHAGTPTLSSLPAPSGIPPPGSRVKSLEPLPEKEAILTPDSQKDDGKGLQLPASPACDLCSTPITEAERKTSQLFTSKNLCRTCMKKP